MPYRLDLTWLPDSRRWRKRYAGRTFYLRTKGNGKTDRKSYLAALNEWERLKAYIDGLGPTPYTPTGAIIPEDRFQPTAVHVPAVESRLVVSQFEQSGKSGDPLPPWIQSVGIAEFLYPDQVIAKPVATGTPERRISVLADAWLDARRKKTHRGDLTIRQWSEDQKMLQQFRDFVAANCIVFVDQISAGVLNAYRDKLWSDHDAKTLSKIVLRKRLVILCRWLRWLVDENWIDRTPKDLKTYAHVKIDAPKPVFFTIDEIKLLAAKATDRTKLYLMLGLNLGYTQVDVASLEPSMVDFETGIVTRDRHKTGVETQNILWPSTLALLKKHRNPKPGPLLVDAKGQPLLIERINERGNLTRNDTIRLAFSRLLKQARITERSFRFLRKTSSNEVEKQNPLLTSLFLSHADSRTAKHYVNRHYQELFEVVKSLESIFGFHTGQS
jgi:integrase